MECPVCKRNNKRQRLSYIKTKKFKMKKDKDGNPIKVKRGVIRIEAYCENCRMVIQ